MRLNTGNWLNLGLELDLSYDKLKEIEKNYPRDDGSCKREMFHLWLKSCPSASYQRLAEAYEKAGEEDMADMIRRELNRDIFVFVCLSVQGYSVSSLSLTNVRTCATT